MTTLDHPPLDRRAQSASPLHDLIAHRWSSRSYLPDADLDDDTLTTLLEAARWAPSASNHQPRRFIVGRRGGDAFERIVATLKPANRLWVPRAAAVVLGIAVREDEEGNPYRFADYDLGQSFAHLTIQAEALGLNVRQVAGFHADEAARAFGLEHPLEPRAIAVVGRRGALGDLAPELVEREIAPRVRRPLDDLVLRRD